MRLPKQFKFNFIKPFPATFEDELSQYEVLAKLLHKINEVIEYLNQLEIDRKSADKLTTPRLIELVNEVLGEQMFDGSKDIKISTTISEDFLNNLMEEIEQLIQNLINEIDYQDLLNQIENMINNIISEIEPYQLPIATSTTLGGVKVVGGESGIDITDGVIHLVGNNPTP